LIQPPATLNSHEKETNHQDWQYFQVAEFMAA
jgi:hypothetical protein